MLLVIGSWLQVRTGLGPLNDVSGRVAAVRCAAKARIGTDLPTEILPLAQEIDLLLDERDENIARARHRAADLAHGFKTPLQALFGDAAELQTKGETHLAESIETIASSMQTLVDRELKRARILSTIVARAEAGEVIRRVVEVLRRTPGGKAIEWTIDADNECQARIHADDLMEAMGAILENACRFAKRRVAVRVGRHGQYIEVRTRDDGPGVSTADLSTIIRRGVRLDESAAGDGIGLALAAEILDAAGAKLSLQNASPGLRLLSACARLSFQHRLVVFTGESHATARRAKSLTFCQHGQNSTFFGNSRNHHYWSRTKTGPWAKVGLVPHC